MQERIRSRENIAYNPEFAAFMQQGALNNDVERRRFRALLEMNLLSLEWEYKQTLSGSLGSIEMLVQKWRNDFRNLYTNPDYPRYAEVREIWSGFKGSLTPEFVAFWEGEIINP